MRHLNSRSVSHFTNCDRENRKSEFDSGSCTCLNHLPTLVSFLTEIILRKER